MVQRLLTVGHQGRVLSRRPRPTAQRLRYAWVTGDLRRGVAAIVHCATTNGRTDILRGYRAGGHLTRVRPAGRITFEEFLDGRSLPPGPRWCAVTRVGLRAGLVFLALTQIIVGGWILILPGVFYDHSWVSMQMPYNEHLLLDFGAMNLALAVMLVAASLSLEYRLTAQRCRPTWCLRLPT